MEIIAHFFIITLMIGFNLMIKMFLKIFAHSYLNYNIRINQGHIVSLSYYITTPIFYVNSKPHIGHVYTTILADTLNRYQRLKYKSDDTLFSTGTDEHGLKVINAANGANKDVLALCHENSTKFRALFESFGLTTTDFIRTSELRHLNAVQSIWHELLKSELIYKGTYSGWYCTSDEAFVPESQVEEKVMVDGQRFNFTNSGKEVHWCSEENYMFRFNLFKESILKWLKIEKPITPIRFNDEAISILNSMDSTDISVSRPIKRVPWGIEVPNDKNHVIYVWLDALTNYLTVSGYPCELDQLKRWPIDCQILGKDILKFHAIIWPAILMGLSLPLPRKLICHSHWLVGSEKMSKSLGNAIDPDVEGVILTKEGLRYYLLRAGTPHSDTVYSRDQAIQRINSELANTYANLLSRASSAKINPDQRIPTIISDSPKQPEIMDLKKRLDEIRLVCEHHFEICNFYNGIQEIMDILRMTNKIYEKAQPWSLVKKKNIEYYDTQAITFESLRVCSILLQPIIPDLSNVMLELLNVKSRSWIEAETKLGVDWDRPLGVRGRKIIYPRIEDK